ncbi:MAG: hypothetical protein WA410_08060 [Candidatus Binatus sp.]
MEQKTPASYLDSKKAPLRNCAKERVGPAMEADLSRLSLNRRIHPVHRYDAGPSRDPLIVRLRQSPPDGSAIGDCETGNRVRLLTIAVIANGMTITAEKTIEAVMTASTVKSVRWQLRRQRLSPASGNSLKITLS